MIRKCSLFLAYSLADGDASDRTEQNVMSCNQQYIQYIICRYHTYENGAEGGGCCCYVSPGCWLGCFVDCLTDGGVRFRYWNFQISIINLKTIRSDRSSLLYLVSGVAAAVSVLC